MASDGNCLYRSLGDQLEGRNERHGQIRTKICDYMEKHVDDFAPFIEDDEKPEDYFPRMRKEGEWGGQPELCAASRCFEVNIVIHQLDAPRLEISYNAKAPTIHLSFHGEAHYNSVRALNDPCNSGEPAMPFLDVTVAPPVASGAGGGKEEGEEKKKKKKKKKEKEEEEGGEEVEEKNGNKAEGRGEEEAGEDDEVQNEKETDTETGDRGREEGKGQPPQPGGGGDEQEEGGGENKKVGGQCPCGSGKKWRKCCRKAEKQRQRVMNSQSGNDKGNGSGGGSAAAKGERKKAGGEEGGDLDGVEKKLEAISL